jgi:vacuolar-type H+-ATPase subunit H
MVQRRVYGATAAGVRLRCTGQRLTRDRRIHTQARAHKQSTIMESEGRRDGMIKEAEGEAQVTLKLFNRRNARVRPTNLLQELLSRAEGQAQAIINAATAEARAVKEIARSIAASGENPAKYLLAMKYVRGHA